VLYTIRVSGRLGDTTLGAFPEFASDLHEGDTLLTGPVTDCSALYGVLCQIEALGLELLEVRRRQD